MKRYDPELGSTYYGHPVAEMAEDERGEYVRFEDFERAIKAVLDRKFNAPNGIWSMPHNIESMKAQLRELLGSPEQRSGDGQ